MGDKSLAEFGVATDDEELVLLLSSKIALPTGQDLGDPEPPHLYRGTVLI
jgi:hypothetical protein